MTPKYEKVPIYRKRQGGRCREYNCFDSTSIDFGPRGLELIHLDSPYAVLRSFQHYVQGGRLFREVSPAMYYLCYVHGGSLDDVGASKFQIDILEERESTHYWRRLVMELSGKIKELKDADNT